VADPYTVIHWSTLQRDGIKDFDIRILLALSILQGKNPSATVTQARIARTAGVSKSRCRVPAAIRRLEAAKLIEVKRKKSTSKQTIKVHAVTAHTNRIYWLRKDREIEAKRRAELTLVPMEKSAPE